MREKKRGEQNDLKIREIEKTFSELWETVGRGDFVVREGNKEFAFDKFHMPN